MNKFFLLIFMITPFFVSAQVIPVESLPNRTVRVEGRLEEGQKIEDLSWAWNSQNACFVATQQAKFTGQHVLYQTELPQRAELFIKVIPKDKNANFSLYAYSGNGKSIVPALSSCVSCEADYKWDFKRRGKVQDHTRTVSLRAINNPYVVTIGVVGADGLSSGDFTLELKLVGGETKSVQEQRPIPTYQLKGGEGATQQYQGNLAKGEVLHDLSWAWSSQNACFVAPRKEAFSGNHLLYLTQISPRTEMTITLKPDDKSSNMSLYAYSHGGNDYRLVPNLTSCVSCEADFQSAYTKEADNTRQLSLRAVNNPYKVVIGIAGADGLTEGGFTLIISTD